MTHQHGVMLELLGLKSKPTDGENSDAFGTRADFAKSSSNDKAKSI